MGKKKANTKTTKVFLNQKVPQIIKPVNVKRSPKNIDQKIKQKKRLRRRRTPSKSAPK